MPSKRILVLLLALFSTEAHAYIRTMASSGRPLYWGNPSLSFQANPTNNSGLSDAQVSSMLTDAVGAWAVAGTRASARVSVNAGYAVGSQQDGVNRIYFASRAGRILDSGVVAVTEVLYRVSTGDVVEADMVFNDNRYRFTANEGDTGTTIGGRVAVYLRDVATHEAGHAFGLDHSLVNLSTMIYTIFSGQFVPSQDDANGIRTLYPSGGSSAAIYGYVRGTNGGIFGAHVMALNLDTGRAEAGAIAGTDGGVRLGDVPPGHYVIMAEPFGSDVDSISSYYENVNHRFCGGTPFRRRFYGPCNSAQAAVVEVTSGSNTVDLGTIAPSCSQMGNPDGTPSSISRALSISSNGGVVYGTLRPGDSHYYRVRNVSGDLIAKAFAFQLYSGVDLSVRILDSNGDPISGTTNTDNLETMRGGKINYDAMSAVNNLPTGDYILAVTAGGTRLPSSAFSAGFDLLDAAGHYLLALNVNGSFGSPSTPDMSACVSVANRSQGASFRAPAATRSNQEKEGGGCGTLGTGGGGGPLSGSLTQVLVSALLLQICLRFRPRRWRALVRPRR